ncbi:hypothetical protein [Halobellus rubicundus]|uniref:Uncharacterized protein n=1 Tax=Halobellus rubicundus TaxID=2996466 RepID=A0ABD5M7Z6_9EURY
MQLDLSGFDAVFREGHDKDYFERDLTVGYSFYAVGHLMYGATFGRVYNPPEEFREKVEESGTPFFEVDADVHETYEMVPRWKRTFLLLGSPIFTLIVLGSTGQVVIRGLGFLGLTAPTWIPYLAAVLLVLFFGLTWPLGFFGLIEGEAKGGRDDYMTERIQEITAENGFENVFVSCGDAHRKPIARSLEQDDWKVVEQPSKHWLARIISLADRITGRILSPIETIKEGKNQIRNRI